MRVPVTHGIRDRLAFSSPRMNMGGSTREGGARSPLNYRSRIDGRTEDDALFGVHNPLRKRMMRRRRRWRRPSKQGNPAKSLDSAGGDGIAAVACPGFALARFDVGLSLSLGPFFVWLGLGSGALVEGEDL